MYIPSPLPETFTQGLFFPSTFSLSFDKIPTRDNNHLSHLLLLFHHTHTLATHEIQIATFFLLEIFQVQQQLTGDPSNGCNPTGCVVALDGHSPPSLSWPVPSRCIKVHSASSQPDTASAPSLNKFPVFRTRPIIGRGGTEEDAG